MLTKKKISESETVSETEVSNVTTTEAEAVKNSPATTDAPLTKVVYFDDKAEQPKNKLEEDKLMLVALYLRKHPTATVTISGYADKVSDGEKKSEELSKNRAVNAANTLIRKYSIASERIQVGWFGAQKNAALNKMVLLKTSK